MGVARVDGRALWTVPQLGGRVLADRGQQAVARLIRVVHDLHERAIDQHREQVEHVGGVELVAGRDTLGGCQRERAAEDAEPAEQALLVGLEHLVAPGEHSIDRAVALGRRSRRLAQEARIELEPLGDLADRQDRDSRRGELDRQRHPVEPLADAAHAFPNTGSVGIERGRRLAGPLHEQRHGAVVRVVGPTCAWLGGVAGREPGHAPDLLARDAQRLAAGRDHSQRRGPLEQRHDQLGTSLDDLLAVVEREQHRLGKLASECRRSRVAAHLAIQHTRRDDLGHELGLERRREIDPPGPADEVGPHRVSQRHCQPRLAGATGAAQGQHAGAPHEGAELGQGGIPAHQPGQLNRHIAGQWIPMPRWLGAGGRAHHLSASLGFLNQ